MKPTISIILEKRNPKSDDTYPVKLRLTIDRKSNYYGLGYDLSEDEFSKLFTPKSRNGKVRDELLAEKKRAEDIVKGMDTPDIQVFKRLFTGKGTGGNVKQYYQSYIAECKKDNRLGTASSYECSMNSLNSLMGIEDIRFRDITVNWLKEYEKKMLKAGKSVSSIGIYLRPLRFLYNRAIKDRMVDNKYYPFIEYDIPTSENHKRPLRLFEMEKLARYKGNPLYEYYRDYFLLSFHINGINFKDLLMLQKTQLKDGVITYIRAKTALTRRKQKPIAKKLNSQTMDIIERIGTGTGKYIFPILDDKDSDEIIRQKIMNHIRNTNQALKKLAVIIGINPDISTIFARHTYTSISYKRNISAIKISESLGHTSLGTTTAYLSSMDEEEEFTEATTLDLNEKKRAVKKVS
jgi:integrase